MPQEKSEAVVLYGVDYSESSRIVTFLSPQRGRLACLAKGVRRKNSPLAAVLDTYNRLELVYFWKEGRQIQNLSEASLLDNYSGIKQDLARNVFAGFVLEITSKIAHDNEPSEELYASLVQGMTALTQWPGDAQAHACWQTFRLLSSAGFEPELNLCVSCGEPVSGPAGFSLSGGVTCRQCRSDRRLTAPVYEGLQALSASPEACPALETPKELFAVLRAYAAHQLDTDFRSVRVLDQLFS